MADEEKQEEVAVAAETPAATEDTAQEAADAPGNADEPPAEETLPSQDAPTSAEEEEAPAAEEGVTTGEAAAAAGEAGAETAPEPGTETAAPEDGTETTAPEAEDSAPAADAPAGEAGEGTGQEAAEAAQEPTAEQTEGEAQPTEAPAEGTGEPQQADGETAAEKSQTPPAEGQAEEDAEKKAQSPIPQSDTFVEGEAEEPPVLVSEKLSREGSPVDQQKVVETPVPLEPGTPEKPASPAFEGEMEDRDMEGEMEDGEMEDEEEEEEEELEPEFDRDELVEKYQAALAVRERLHQQNAQLQNKLAEYFRKKKTDESRQDMDKNVTDQEQRYLKYMSNLEELHHQEGVEQDLYQQQIEDLLERRQDKERKAVEEWERYQAFKREVALTAINSRSGKPVAPKDVEQIQVNETKKEQEVAAVRLENIKLKNQLKKRELQLKQKEELAEGLHLIDFEQLKIENQTYNEKIEERNEELLKLRKKITSTVQVLTHLKEKLQFVQAENHVQKGKLREVEELVAKKRDVLSRTKQARDALRIDNMRLRQKSGLLGNEPLLRDYEERRDEGDGLKFRLENLKMKHTELTMDLNGVKRKIDQVRSTRM
ncbi:PREDICTED: coiled-coil domain-containing protein 96-like isoform X1 [Branchiostoma belcheri]|uniref:Coiled-coil domain-containing protein 96-like isoform X1 n=1 Tax=Branchiostoma belcheri TaxID=7741 RepID=A0A6P4XBQ7_BRABE|nr:PREDICTED: coiled-coil domain-containing protein 96-like isoform X1 [Branchiostoma belcheri]